MNDYSPSIPYRVLAIALAIVAGLALVFWSVSRLGSPTRPIEDLTIDAANDAEPDAAGAASADLTAAAPGGDPAAGGNTNDPNATSDPAADQAAQQDADPNANEQALEVATEPVSLQLFLVDAASMRLIPRRRRIRAPLTLAAKAHVALQQLVRADGSLGLSPLPSGTEVREVWVSRGGIAYVDFGSKLLRLLPGGSMSEIHAVYGVVGTLTGSFPGIRAVHFLIDGSPIETLNGHLDLSGPIFTPSSWPLY